MIIIRTRENWRHIIKDQEKSLLTQKEHCENHDINAQTFSKMKCLLKKEAKKNNLEIIKPNFVMAVVEDNKNAEKENNPLMLEIGSFKIIIKENFNDEVLTKLCKVLVELC